MNTTLARIDTRHSCDCRHCECRHCDCTATTHCTDDRVFSADRREPRALPGDGGTARYLTVHYVEMVLAMLAGTAALHATSSALVDLPDHTGARLVGMAVGMTVPMVAWMRVRGHTWHSCVEMAAAMLLLPPAVALSLLGIGVAADGDGLLMAQHVAVFPIALTVMLWRRGALPDPVTVR